MDFRVLNHFAHETERAFSEDRWGVVGEAGAFLDPYYSPGSDFIAMSNTWLSDLILRDLKGEDISLRADIYEQAYLSHVQNWIPIYQNKYLLMGNTQIMVMKIFWDWAIYWAIPCVMFTNKAFTDLKTMKELFSSKDSLGRKFGRLNKTMQDFFLEWLPYDKGIVENKFIDPYDVEYLSKFQKEIVMQHEPKKIVEQISINMEILEKVAAAIFRLVSTKVKGTPSDMKVDPYSISFEGDLSKHENGMLPDEAIANDVKKMWFY